MHPIVIIILQNTTDTLINEMLLNQRTAGAFIQSWLEKAFYSIESHWLLHQIVISYFCRLCWGRLVCGNSRWLFSTCHPRLWSWMFVEIVSVDFLASETCPTPSPAMFSDSLWRHRWPVARPMWKPSARWTAIRESISVCCLCQWCHYHSTRRCHCPNKAATSAAEWFGMTIEVNECTDWRQLINVTHVPLFVNGVIIQFGELFGGACWFFNSQSELLSNRIGIVVHWIFVNTRRAPYPITSIWVMCLLSMQNCHKKLLTAVIIATNGPHGRVSVELNF